LIVGTTTLKVCGYQMSFVPEKESQKRIYDIATYKVKGETIVDAWFADEFDPSVIFLLTFS
jgi:hypothetical protein